MFSLFFCECTATIDNFNRNHIWQQLHSATEVEQDVIGHKDTTKNTRKIN